MRILAIFILAWAAIFLLFITVKTIVTTHEKEQAIELPSGD